MQLEPTPTVHRLPFRPADFASLPAALDYAAQGETGVNFYTGRGSIYSQMSYRQLRDDAVALAKKLIGLGFVKGDRVALVAETAPHFLRFFFASQYAGLVPVPLPAAVKLGAHTSYVSQLHRLLKACDAQLAVASEGYLSFLTEAGEGLPIRMVDKPETFDEMPAAADVSLPLIDPNDIAYLQYTSGSTRFPKGVMIRHRTAMSNLAGIITHGVKVQPEDRCMSWLPFYHDMGLVGFLFVPVAAQLSVDYLDTLEFAMRPRQWLNLLTETRATISFSPCFGYDLCARRLRNGEVNNYDLSNWRVAGIGAEMIRTRSLDLFAEALAPAGFNPKAFLACYGMAECTLGVSFSPLGAGYSTDYVDHEQLLNHHKVVLIEESDERLGRHFVNCGAPLPDYRVEVRDKEGNVLGENSTGLIHLSGPSVMSGYFGMPEETRHALSEDGWLNTGDLGYLSSGTLTITGRIKDLIIIHGRNIWPQDIEHLCETQPEVRVGDVLAFSAAEPDGEEHCVVLVQCREIDEAKCEELVHRLTGLVREELSLDCRIELVAPHSLPVTSSGKLSRSKARLEFMASLNVGSANDQVDPFEKKPLRISA
ncbi:fatty acyl-AMP ligase [Porticoccus sp.]